MSYILQTYSISDEEYDELLDQFDKLIYFIAWKHIKTNRHNNLTDELEDVIQELRIALVQSAGYYKRQCYILNCFDALKTCKEPIIEELRYKWDNRIKHGARKRLFGQPEEQILNNIINYFLPEGSRPQIEKIKINTKYKTYCKSILWNAVKALGRKITKEQPIRQGITSLSEFEYIGNNIL